MRSNTCSCCSASPTDRHDDHLQPWLILQHLQCLRAYTSNKQWFIARVNVAVAMLLGQRLTVQLCFIKCCSMKDHLGSHALHRGHLPRICCLWHNDASLDTKQSGCIRHRLPMIAGGGSNHAPRSLLWTELGDQVDAPTNFEGTDRLVVFMLAVLYTYQISLFSGQR